MKEKTFITFFEITNIVKNLKDSLVSIEKIDFKFKKEFKIIISEYIFIFRNYINNIKKKYKQKDLTEFDIFK